MPNVIKREGLLARRRAARKSRAPRTARALILVLSAFVVGMIVWAGRTEIQELARAPGEIVPTDNLRRIEHFDGGIVERVHVRQGDPVSSGDVLAVLSSPSLIEAEDETRHELALMQARQRTLLALADAGAVGAEELEAYARVRRELHLTQRAALETRAAGREEALITIRRAGDVAHDRVEIAEGEYERLKTLADAGYLTLSVLKAQEDRLQAVKGELVSNESALARAQAEHADARAAIAEADLAYGREIEEQLFEVGEEILRLEQQLDDLAMRRERLVVRAPEDGVVQLSASARGGEVIEPGELLFELLPTSARLVAEVRLSPTDIGHVDVGDVANIKSSTYDARRYGELHGRVAMLSPSSLLDPDGNPYFAARIDLGTTRLSGGVVPVEVTSGMVVTAEIPTARRTVLDYLAAPIRRSLDLAMSER